MAFPVTSAEAVSDGAGNDILVGNVGIGTTTPAAKLHVDGAIYSGPNLPTHSDVSLTASGDAMFGGDVEIDQLLYVDGAIYGEVHGSGAYLTGLAAASNLTTNSVPRSQSDGHTLIDSGVYVLDNGNVGIGGITAPLQPLHVNGQCVTGDTRLRRRRKKLKSPSPLRGGEGEGGVGADEYIYDDIRIDAIQPGDEIQSLDEKTGLLVWSRVNSLMDMGVKNIYKLTTASGKTIRTTGNHPYLVRSEYPISTNFMHDSVFAILSRLAREFYHRVLVKMPMRVPCMNDETVVFSHQGWDHLLDKERSRLNLLSRYMALPKVIPLLSDPLARMTYEKRGDYEFWAIHGVVDGVRIKVIVRSIKGGGKHFYSVLWMGEDEGLKKKQTAYDAVRSLNSEAVSCLYPQCQGVGTLQLQLEYRRFVAQMSRVISKSTAALINAQYKKKSGQAISGTGTWTRAADLCAMDFIAVAGQDHAEYEQVVRIEHLPAEQVWDIEVDGTHNFVGNDIVAHNTYLSGNVGINSTNPRAKLDVEGTVYAGGDVMLGNADTTYATSNEDLLVNGNIATDADIYGVKGVFSGAVSVAGASTLTGAVTAGAGLTVTDTAVVGSSAGRTYATTTGSLYVQDRFEVDGDVYLGDLSTDNLTVAGSLTLQSNMNLTGNVGINTTVPLANLEIVRSPSSQAPLKISSAAGQDGDYLTVTSGGRVGIGTTDPGALFVLSKDRVNGSIYVQEYLDAKTMSQTQVGSGIVTGYSRGNGATFFGAVGGYANGTLDQQGIGIWSAPTVTSDIVNGAPNLFVAGGGNVGINTTTPAAKLHVDGAVYAGTSMPTHSDVSLTASGDAMFGGDVEIDRLLYVDGAIYGEVHGSGAYLTGLAAASNLTTNSVPRAQSDGHTLIDSGVYVLADGNVGIGTVAPLQPLHVNGQCVTGDTRLRRRRKKLKSPSPLRGGEGEGVGADEYIYDEIRIDQIQPGDEIQSLDEKTGRLVWSRVNALMDMGVKDIYKLTTASGKTIRTTGNHPYFIRQPLANTNILHDTFFDMIEAAARQLYFTVFARAQVRVPVLGNEIVSISRQGWDHLREGEKQRSRLNLISRYFALPKIVSLLTSPYAKVEYRKGTEAEFWALEGIVDNVALKVILRSIAGGKKYFYSVVWLGEQKSRPVSESAEMNGVVSRLYPRRRGVITPQLHLKYSRYPGLLSSSIAANAEKFIHHNYAVDGPGILTEDEGEWIKVIDIKEGDLIAVANAAQAPHHSGQQAVWDKVVRIETLPPEQVWDIEIDGTHNFVGNDIIAHNTYLSGNVGINSTDPRAKLDVEGAVYAGGDVTLGDAATTYATSNEDLLVNGNIATDADIYGVKAQLSSDISVGGNADVAGRVVVGNNALRTYAVNSGDVYVQNNLEVDGNVYLGDLSTDNLTVAGSLTLQSNMNLTGNVGINTTVPLANLEIVRSPSSQAPLKISSAAGAGGDYLTVTSDGNVGIGTVSPSQKFDVYGNATVRGLVYAKTLGFITDRSITGAVGGYGFENDVNTGMVSEALDTLTFITGGLRRIDVNAVGNVGINTTTPAAKLHVDGAIYSGPNLPTHSDVSLTASGDAMFGGDVEIDQLLYVDGAIYGTVHGSGAYLTGLAAASNLAANSVPRAQFDGHTLIDSGVYVLDNGNVGIGGITAPLQPLHVNGQCVTGDTRLRRRRRKTLATSGVAGGLEEYVYDEIRIDQIQPGDEIQSLDEKTGRLVWSRVNALMDMGVKDIYKLTTASGKTIRTTGNHPYFVNDEKCPGIVASIGGKFREIFCRNEQNRPQYFTFIDEVGTVRDSRQPYFGVGALTLKMSAQEVIILNRRLRTIFLKAVNALKAEEKLFEFKFKAVTSRNVTYFQEMIRLLREYKGRLVFSCAFTDDKHLIWERYIQLTRDVLDPACRHIVFADYLDKPKAAREDISDIVDDAIVEKVLQVEAQGSLFVQLADILLGAVNMHLRANEDVNEYKKQLRDDVLVLLKEMGGRKKWAAIDFVYATRKDDLSIEENLVVVKNVAASLTKRQISLSAFHGSWRKVVNIKEGDLIAVAGAAQDPHHSGQQAVWDKVVKIETLPPEQVWDIEVDGTHNFVGNDIIAHNTYLSGNVGINSTDPRAKLDVEGTVYAGADVTIGLVTAEYTTGNPDLVTQGNIETDANVYVAGNVGIGTSIMDSANVPRLTITATELQINLQ